MKRVAIYEMQNGETEEFVIADEHSSYEQEVNAEKDERASADREMHSRHNAESSNPIVGYHFEWRD